jgi:hypothetical protein
MFKRLAYVSVFGLFATGSFSQTGGDNVYEFLNLTHSGLVASLGGSNVSLSQSNLNLSWHNPALLDSGMNKCLSLNYVNYFAGINYGLALYSWSTEGPGNWATGITYLDYGSFIEADEAGNITGSFRASESALSVIYSRQLDSMFSVGLNLKPVFSHLEKYTSIGFAFDLGISWHNKTNLLSAGFVIRNIGYQLTTYAGESRNTPPFEIMAGISAKLAHAPVRFSLTARHLEKYNLTYNYSADNESVNNTSPDLLENMMKHFIAAAEIIPHKNLYLSLGYNHQRRSELQAESKAGGTGFCWGFGLNTSLLNIEFGSASYHLAGSSTHFSVVFRPDAFYSRFSNKN